jgi:hypothetical protein
MKVMIKWVVSQGKKKTCFPKLVKEDLCKLGTTQKIIKMAKDLFYRKH